MGTLYEEDHNAWSDEQILHLKNRDFEKLDIDNLIFEIDNLGTRTGLEHALTMRIIGKLKQKYHPEDYLFESDIINSHRVYIRIVLEDLPGMIKVLEDTLQDSYEWARKQVFKGTEIDLSTIPEKCPWTLEELIK